MMAADEHDEAVAQVSHLPQLMSSLTAGRLVDVPPEHLRLAGQGIRDVTRIAGSDPDLWQQIVAANADAVRIELLAVQDALAGLVAVLDDPEAVREFIARGRQGTRALPGKHGHRATDFAHVVVEIPDAPGSLRAAVRGDRRGLASTSRTSRSSTTRPARSATCGCRSRRPRAAARHDDAGPWLVGPAVGA